MQVYLQFKIKIKNIISDRKSRSLLSWDRKSESSESKKAKLTGFSVWEGHTLFLPSITATRANREPTELVYAEDGG